MYKEYPPDIRLSHLIETYWVADGDVENSFSQRILPDGCVDIIFDFEQHEEPGKFQTGLPELVGTMTSLLEITYQPGRVRMMGIRFAPGGITAFTRMPVFEFTDRNIELPISETVLDKNFYERLPDMNCMQHRLTHINQYFLARLNELYVPDKQIGHAVSYVRTHNGQLSIKQLAKEVCLSERQFERKFKTAIGISPKIFCNVMRFRFTRQYIKMHPDESIDTIATACGYYDHSHLIREFKRFASELPKKR